MADKMDTEIWRRSETLAQYITIPRDIVMDSAYPFDRESDKQKAIIRIDNEKKLLIIEPVKK